MSSFQYTKLGPSCILTRYKYVPRLHLLYNFGTKLKSNIHIVLWNLKEFHLLPRQVENFTHFVDLQNSVLSKEMKHLNNTIAVGLHRT